jgi:cysteine desulfurase
MDASLSFTHLDINTDSIQADMISFSGHKIHGPKGIGALYVRKGVEVKKWSHGGYNEFDLRPGTENVPGAVGFGKAVQIAEAV